jgi:hypothetical protein
VFSENIEKMVADTHFAVSVFDFAFDCPDRIFRPGPVHLHFILGYAVGIA